MESFRGWLSQITQSLRIQLKQLCVATILLILLVALSNQFRHPAPPMDEGVLLVYPELVLKGQLPYRDFETFYGPANIGVLATAYKIFGTTIFVERAVGLIYRLLILPAIFRLTRRSGLVLATGCVAVAAS
jgi:hypothetical protein